MPPKSGNETSNPFCFRPGIKGFPGFGGVDRRNDPGSIPANKFYNLENVRIVGQELVSRGGQSKLNTQSPLAGAVLGIFDAPEPDFEPKIYFGDAGDISAFNENQTPVTQSAMTGSDGPTSTSIICGVYNNRPIILEEAETADQATFKSFRFFSGRGIGASSNVLPTTEFTASMVGDSTTFGDSEGLQIGSNFWIMRRGTDGSTSHNRVYVWNGLTFSLSDTMTGYYTPSPAAHKFAVDADGNMYYQGISADGSQIRCRMRSLSSGSWSTLCTSSTLAPSTLNFNLGVGTGSITSYSSSLYTGVDDNGNFLIYSISGSGYTLARSITTAVVHDLISFGGYLYFLYRKSGEMRLGRYDGSSWTDAYATNMIDDPGASNKYRLLVSEQTLYAIRGNSTGTFVQIFKSSGTDTSVWTEEQAGTNDHGHNISDPVVVV